MFIWTITDAINLFVLLAFILILTITGLYGWLKQYRCKHVKYFENSQCNAICRACGKDLGFIGTLRDKGVGR